METEQRECTACGYAEQQAIDHLAALTELLNISRWFCAGIMTGEGLYETTEFAQDYVFYTRYAEDGTLVAGGKWAGYYFDEGAILCSICEDESGSAAALFVLNGFEGDRFYYFANEVFPSYLYVLGVADDGAMAFAAVDPNGEFILYYAQDY